MFILEFSTSWLFSYICSLKIGILLVLFDFDFDCLDFDMVLFFHERLVLLCF